MSAAHDPQGDPMTWPCPPYRWLRHVAYSESLALRAYARTITDRSVTVAPLNAWADYAPRTDWRRLAWRPERVCHWCDATIGADRNADTRFCDRRCQNAAYKQARRLARETAA